MYQVADRNGEVTEKNSLQDRIVRALYCHAAGRALLKPLVSESFSKLGGRLLDSKLSRGLIGPFVRSNGIDLTEYEQREYLSYNDFFKRKMASNARRIEETPESFVSPCDCSLGVYAVDEKSRFEIKYTSYTVQSLLKNEKLAEKFYGGYVWVFRLGVEDYHRYIYVDDARVSKGVRISGKLHTVSPIAGDCVPIYKENTREYVLMKTRNFKTVLHMEVGAMLVGKIENHPASEYVKRGQEKGNFAFGGSTIILMTQKGVVRPDADILQNSKKGIETKVHLGESVGIAPGQTHE